MKRLRLGVLMVAATLGMLGGPAGDAGPREGVERATKGTEAPRLPRRITRSPVNRGARLHIDPKALPPGARAQFPAYDGDAFFVTFPARRAADVKPAEVFSQVIRPVLRAVGFERAPGALATPPAGVTLPVPSFRGLAEAVDFEYRANPGFERPRTRRMLDAFLKGAGDAEVDRALMIGRGMSLRQFINDLERREIQYPFQQVHEGVPIEFTMLLASRWDGEQVTFVRGAVLSRYDVSNVRRLAAREAVAAAGRALARLRGVTTIISRRPDDGPYPVLLPYGSKGSRYQLRHAYRMLLRARWIRDEVPFVLWLDADDAKILRLEPLFGAATAHGLTFNRDPGPSPGRPPIPVTFEVDGPSGGYYTLELSAIMHRLDYLENSYDAEDVQIPAAAVGAADFDQAPINTTTPTWCAAGANKAFQQVNVFATVYRHRAAMVAAGIWEPFPASPWWPTVETQTCGSWSSLRFGVCQGYSNSACPAAADGSRATTNLMNFAHDNTMVGHEVGHNATSRLTVARPGGWCGAASCATVYGWGELEDLADFWGAHLESTPCIGGWVAQNLGGLGASLYCASHDKTGLPRKLEVPIPFDPANPGDHFPEGRGAVPEMYTDGQIVASALWNVRNGMRSKCRPSGLPQFSVRFQRALMNSGILGAGEAAPGASTRDVYRRMWDLEKEMVNQWASAGSPGGPPAFAHNGAHTVNKVTAGFASAGFFLVPWQCLDADATTTEPTDCPGGADNGGDAVVDIDDNDSTDDVEVNGIPHPEHDFLRYGPTAPTFRVWTGPRYRLTGPAGHTTGSPAPCNAKFQVEVTTDPSFTTFVSSGWTAVSTDPTGFGGGCYGQWQPDSPTWTALRGTAPGALLYYRARTRDANDGNERLSTRPGNGRWGDVPPPYAVITADGRSDY